MPTLSRSTIALRIFGDTLNPDELTQRLGHPPSSAANTGETITSAYAAIRVVRQGFWILDHHEHSAEGIEGQINHLFGKLTTDIQVWHEITQAYHVDLFCGVFMDYANEGFSLSSTTTQLLAERNVPISFDMYAPVEPDRMVNDKNVHEGNC
jgi:hypothetical protein